MRASQHERRGQNDGGRACLTLDGNIYFGEQPLDYLRDSCRSARDVRFGDRERVGDTRTGVKVGQHSRQLRI